MALPIEDQDLGNIISEDRPPVFPCRGNLFSVVEGRNVSLCCDSFIWYYNEIANFSVMTYCYYFFALLKYLYPRVFRRKGHNAFSEVLCHKREETAAIMFTIADQAEAMKEVRD